MACPHGAASPASCPACARGAGLDPPRDPRAPATFYSMPAPQAPPPAPIPPGAAPVPAAAPLGPRPVGVTILAAILLGYAGLIGLGLAGLLVLSFGGGPAAVVLVGLLVGFALVLLGPTAAASGFVGYGLWKGRRYGWVGALVLCGLLCLPLLSATVTFLTAGIEGEAPPLFFLTPAALLALVGGTVAYLLRPAVRGWFPPRPG